MDLESIITNGIYGTPLAMAATYVDASGDQTTVNVVHDQAPEIQLVGAELGVRGQAIALRLRVAELAQPCPGDYIDLDGVRYCIDAIERANLAEWRCYVVT